MVLYRITLVPLEEELRYVDPTLFSPFYANDAAQLRLMMERETDQGYLPKPAKSLFYCRHPGG